MPLVNSLGNFSAKGLGAYDGIATFPPTFVSVSSASSADTPLSISRPANTVSGLLMIAFINQSTPDDLDITSTGWTRILNGIAGEGVEVLTKVAGGSEPSNYSFSSNKGGETMQGYIVTYSRADIDVVGAIGSAGDPCTAPSITVTTNRSIVLAHFSRRNDSSITFSTPTGFSSVSSDSNATAPSSALFSKGEFSPGATGGVVSDPSGSNSSRGFLIAIKPV
jgi:hypothetical protein